MFLNLSNHPSAGWSHQQRAAAEALGGEILDHPFPDVPPEATAGQVAEIGAAFLSKILSPPPAAAMIQGEFTLTYYLVHALEAHGVPCYAATTRRVVESVPIAGGGIDKRSRFDFVQLRRYASPR